MWLCCLFRAHVELSSEPAIATPLRAPMIPPVNAAASTFDGARLTDAPYTHEHRRSCPDGEPTFTPRTSRLGGFPVISPSASEYGDAEIQRGARAHDNPVPGTAQRSNLI